MTSLVEKLARPEILALPDDPRSDSDALADQIRLHANESPYAPLAGGEGLNRFPPMQPATLIARMAEIYGVARDSLLVCRDAADAIDLLMRGLCRPGDDAVAALAPVDGVITRAARLQGAQIVSASLSESYEADLPALAKSIQSAGNVKLVFISSPSTTTGAPLPAAEILEFCARFTETLIVVDESYIEFANHKSLAPQCRQHENLVILRSLSHGYGLAGAGAAMIANPGLISLGKKILLSAPLSAPVVKAALGVLSPTQTPIMQQRIAAIVRERGRIAEALSKAPNVRQVYDSEANFLLIAVRDAAALKSALAARGVWVRWRDDLGRDDLEYDPQNNPASGVLRVTIGKPEENQILLDAFGAGASLARQRIGAVSRETKETKIAVSVNLDRTDETAIDTGIGYFDHMLEQIAKHGGFSLILTCKGDLEVDAHHTIEDCMIAFGEAVRMALGDKRGIERFGFALPMDEASAEILIDLSGRAFAKFEGAFSAAYLGDYPTEMTAHAFRSLADSLGAAIHVKVAGDNDHHKTEACFKAFGRAMRQAIRVDGDDVVSTKGVLS